MAPKGNSTVFLSFGPHLFNANVPLSGDPICFKLGSCFPQALFYQMGKKKNCNTSDHVIKKPSWLKKEKLLFWCPDQSIFFTMLNPQAGSDGHVIQMDCVFSVVAWSVLTFLFYRPCIFCLVADPWHLV